MCYETTARPPAPPQELLPIGGGAPSGELVTLKASDGNGFAAFSAKAAAPGGPGIVILPDVRGLHAFYEDLALRFAEAGVHATAFDYFGRTAGVGRRGDDFEFMPEVMKTRPDTIAADVAASVAHVRSDDGGSAGAVFTVGFCFGGRNSLNQAVEGHGLAGVIGFYGVVGESPMFPAETAPVNLAKSYECPVLGLFGGADAMIPQETVDAFGKALSDAGVSNELVTYPGAPHSFFDRAFDQFKDACDDAWTRILGFIRANS